MHVLRKLAIIRTGVQNKVPRRQQWTGPNYSRGVFLIALSAVFAALGTSSVMKYWNFYDSSVYEPASRDKSVAPKKD